MKLRRSSDILFRPSLEELFGYPVAEALAAGIPVVAAKQAQGCAWLLGGGKYGLLADGQSDQAMTDALFEALNRPAAENTIFKTEGQEHIRRLYGESAILAQYQTVYERKRRISE